MLYKLYYLEECGEYLFIDKYIKYKYTKSNEPAPRSKICLLIFSMFALHQQSSSLIIFNI